MKRLGKHFVLGYLTLLVVGSSFGLGVFIGTQRAGNFSGGTNVIFPKSRTLDFSLLEDTYKLIKRDYALAPVDDAALFYGALSGMVESLGDPYSQFFSPQGVQELEQELQGTFEGIGAEIGVRGGQVVIIAPLAGSPAEGAGLLPGDEVLKINDEDTTGMPLGVAVSKIRGPKGSTVTLQIRRKGSEEGQTAERTITITRETIKVESVTWKLEKDPKTGASIARIDLSHFNNDTAAKFRSFLPEIALANPKGIILDLRNNPGGFLDAAIDVASAWVGDGVVMIEEGKDGRKEHHGTSSASLAGFPTVVLINEGSASASEIVAGALADTKRATLVGEKTFGKGTVQELAGLKDNSAVKLTVAKWLTPSGQNINEEGIAPDVEVKRTVEDIDAGRDPQMEKALEILRTQPQR